MINFVLAMELSMLENGTSIYLNVNVLKLRVAAARNVAKLGCTGNFLSEEIVCVSERDGWRNASLLKTDTGTFSLE